MKKAWKRCVAGVLSAVMLVGVCPPSAIALTATDLGEALDYLEVNQVFSSSEGTSEAPIVTPEGTSAGAETTLYQDGAVCVYHALQLYAIGSNGVVHSGDADPETFGTGSVLTDEDGQVLVYGQSQDYRLMNDIALPEGTTWALPSGFAGTFVSERESTEAPLYDEDTDTVYLYNNYQLLTLSSEDEMKTVLSGDNVAETFGMGQVVYTGDQQLEYTQEHNYVVAQSFTAQMPELKAETVLQEGSSWDGRQYEGQVVYYENGVQYILIGNKQQLQAIGKTDENGDPIKVTEPVWAQKQESALGVVWNDVEGVDPVLYYSGDADLKSDGDYTGLFAYDQEVGGNGEKEGNVWSGHTRNRYVGSALKGTEVTYSKDANAYHVNIERKDGDKFEPVYSTIANYIIFRDISLEGVAWTPMMFSGTMEGRLNMVNGNNVTISKVTVNQTGELDASVNLGIGFFGTITNQQSTTNIGVSGGTAKVSHLTLDTVNVANTTTEMKETTSVVKALTGLLGGLLGILGGVVDGIIGILPGANDSVLGKLNLSDTLGRLLKAREAAPDNFATGAFAGRIIGDVLVEDCKVINASVSNVKNMTGGFVGNVEGLTEYEMLSEILGDTVDTLESVLNLIPGLGLGDLVEILLDSDNLLSIKKLIPSDYKQAIIQNCSVTMSSDASTIGKDDTTFNGGFVGCQTGSKISGCTVSGLTSVTAKKYAGGFAGATRDAVIKGLLESLDLSIINLDPSSEASGCRVDATDLAVTAQKYSGGFTGIVANSDISNSSVSGLSAVTTTGHYSGGFAGRATLGSSVILVGEGDIADKGLLGKVAGLLGDVLSGNDADALLNVLGVSPSTLNGCSVNGTDWRVSAGDYAGGFLGQGDGVQVGNGTDGPNSVTNITLVASNGDYAGGIVGQLVPANAGGVVDRTLGIAAVKPYQLSYVSVAGSGKGLTVAAKGKYAGGAIGVSVGGEISNVNANNLKKVSATETAGGFLGSNSAAGLLESDGLNLLGWDLVKIENLLSAVNYFLTNCTNCYVSYCNVDKVEGTENMEQASEPQVTANSAGGFIGEMYGGKLDNSNMPSPLIESAEEGNASGAVRNISYVKGTYYAGGFAGKISSGSLVDAGNGIDLAGLTVSVTDLVKVLELYTPQITCAGVSSGANGLRVEATHQTSSVADAVEDVDSGCAGGYAGLIRGAYITKSNVSSLATKKTFENRESNVPAEGEWAVTAPNNAGGYAGQIDIGSATAAGKGIKVSEIVNIGNLLDVLDVVESRLDQCDVEGMSGGFNVESTNGSAGGYAGEINGSWLNGCDADNYEYIHGVVSAGGFVGTAQPGDMASLLDKTTVLDGLVGVEGLLSVAKAFISRIYNSSTAAVPCGGYVKATGISANGVLCGMAGGYVGYNLGGRIWGDVTADPADNTPLEDSKLAATKRVREVDGKEYAGGFTGLMAAANIADTGGLSLLYGLVNTSNLLSALQAVYPTETNTCTTGPLRDMDYTKWNSWVAAVGSKGTYGDDFKDTTFDNQESLNDFLKEYIYGYTVQADVQDDGTGVLDGGAAGGYVGRMEAGVITAAYAQDVRLVTAHRSAGGFAGEMVTGTVLGLGDISALGIDLTGGLGLVRTFVPVIYTSKVSGYKSGMEIKADGVTNNDNIGNAGGFVGASYGGQIWDKPDENEHISTENTAELRNGKAGIVAKLKDVSGSRYAGGFAGVLDSGSAAEVDVQTESGLLSKILSLLIGSKNIDALAGILEATLPTVQSATVNAAESDSLVMEYVVRDGTRAAGGFVGMAKGAILGRRENTGAGNESLVDIAIYGVRAVIGGEHIGGFVGCADNGGVAEVAKEHTSILNLVGLANVDVLNAFRTYFYNCQVEGSGNGLSVYATKAAAGAGSTTDSTESNQVYQSGNAGGFAGSLLNSSVLDCHVTNLKVVRGLNYVGGFTGLSGKSGVVDVDKVTVFGDILGAAAGVLDIFGSHMDDSTVTGMSGGYTISATGGEDCIAGGFIGYGDLSRVNGCDAKDLKQVYSDAQAGGFVGRTSFAYLAQIDAASPALLDPVLGVVNELLKKLYAGELQNLGVINITLPEAFPGGLKTLELQVLSDGNTLSVTLLGLKISVALVRATESGGSDVAQIHIGDSYIELPCTEQGVVQGDNLKIGLIKANRTKVDGCTVTGVTNGYDVFGGGAGNDVDGTDPNGYAGGFVGYNKEGLLENNIMYQADTIRGSVRYTGSGDDKVATGLVGAFSGKTDLTTEYGNINSLDTIEGQGNYYFVYRSRRYDDKLNLIVKDNSEDPIQLNKLPDGSKQKPFEQTELYDIYAICHRYMVGEDTSSKLSYFTQVWQNAQMSSSTVGNARFPVNVFVSEAQANLMMGVATEQNRDTTVPQGGAMQDPCSGNFHLTIEKIWYDDKDWSDAPRDPITVTLYQDGKAINVDSKEEGETSESTDKSFQMDSTMAGMDANIWTYEVDVPVSTNGVTHTYTVSEEPVDGYVTFYYTDPDDEYTLYILNFLLSELMVADTVVIDYGLSVDVDVLTNDLLETNQITGTLVGVQSYSDKASEILDTFTESTENNPSTVTTTYGTASVTKDSSDVRYTPTSMAMKSQDRVNYVVKLDAEHVKNNQNFITGLLTVIPATEIFYEDNFVQYSPGKQYSGTEVNWTDLTQQETTSDVQDTDRPGIEQVKKVCDDLYGNDTHYADDTTYSNGTTHYVTVDENTKEFPKAEFDFTGTGFDVVSVTSGDTGTVMVKVWNDEKTVSKAFTVDTYYGYTYNKDTGIWEVDPTANGNNALYQVPILKVEDLDWDTYHVEITPVYYDFFDHHYNAAGGDNSYTFYLDAIRIYDPANPDGTDYKEIEDVYQKDGEDNPRFTEIRDILLNAENVSEITSDGAVFVDGNGSLHDIKAYEAYGPKNEVYLTPGQAISFYLWTDHKPDKVQLSAKLDKGTDTQLTVSLAVKTDNGSEWASFRERTYTVQTAYDLYYDLTDLCIWEKATAEDGGKPFRTYKSMYPIVIRNSSAKTVSLDEIETDLLSSENPNENLDDKVTNLLSLTNLQWTGEDVVLDSTPTTRSSSAYDPYELVATADQSNVEAAYYLINPVKQYNVTVKYQDEQGNSLAEDQMLQVYDGAAYDATQLVEQGIKGYQFQQVQGDVTGVATGDVEIIVIYQKLMTQTLQQLIASAQDMVSEADKYVDTHWQQLLDALAAAEQVLSQDDFTQHDVDGAASALQEAIQAQKLQANKEKLKAIVAEAEAMDLSGYTAESVAAFQAALTKAQAMLEDKSLSKDNQDDVNAALEALEVAMDGLTADTETDPPEATDDPQPSDDPQVTQEPQATDEPQASQKPQISDAPQGSQEPETDVPPTGDETGLSVWLTTMFICTAAAVGMGVTAKTRKKNDQQ